jgi:hypothetical protein
MVAVIAGKGWTPEISKRVVPIRPVEEYPSVTNHPPEGTRGTARLGESVLVGRYGEHFAGKVSSVAFIMDGVQTTDLLFVADGWTFTIDEDIEGTEARGRLMKIARPSSAVREEMF